MSKIIETILTHITDDGVQGRLGIGKDGTLYWNEQTVITEQKITLQWWVNLAIIMGSISTLCLGIFEGLRFFGYGFK